MKRIIILLLCCVGSLVSNASVPTNPSTNLTSMNVEGNSIFFSWTNGNGANRLVIARKDNPVTAMPVNGTDYIANNSFGSGNEISTGQFVVYKGNGSSFGLSGLIPNSTYYIAVIEFNGSGFSTEYLTAAFLSGNRSTLSAPTIQASNITISNVTGNSMKLDFTAGNGASRIVVAKAGGPVNANPIDLVSYFPNSLFGTGDQVGSGNYVVAKGGNTVTITGLNPSTAYHFAAFELNGVSGPVYLTVSAPIASQATAPRPTVAASNLSFSNVEGNAMAVNFTPGNGARRIVIVKMGSAVTAIPANGVTYSANTVFGSGQQIAPNEYVVADGVQNSFSLSNLQHSTVYHFAIFEYDGTGANTAYLTSSFLVGNRSTAIQPGVQASNLSAGAITSNSITLNWTNGSGSDRIIVARQGSAVNALPVNFTSYFPSSFGFGAEIGTGNYVVYKGSGATTTIIGLSFNSTYHFTVFEFNGNGAPVYLTASAPTINASTSSAPTIPSNSLSYNITEGNSISLGWNGGNGTGRIVVARAGNPVTGLPVNGTSYVANSIFGSGATIAPGEFVVFSGAGTSVALTNLAIGTTYHFAIFEYNGSGATTTYLTSAFLAGSRTTLAAPTTPTVSMSFSNIIGNAMQVNVTPGNGQNRIIVVKQGSPVDAIPVNFTPYFGAFGYGLGAQIGSGNYVVHAGSQTAFTVTGLQPNTTYYFASFEFNGSGGPVYNTVAPALSNVITLPAPTIPSSNIVFSYIEGNGMQLAWTAGNGTRRIVIARQGSPVTATPVNGINYTANTVFGTGAEISPGQFVVGNTNSNGLSPITNLAIGTQYYFAIFEYDGTGSNIGYLTSGSATNTATTVSAPTVQTSNLLFTSITNNSMTLNWTNGNGSNRLVILRVGSPVTAIPANLTAYFTSVNLPSAGQVSPGNFAVSAGNTSSVSIFGLQPNTTYYFAIFEFNGSSAPVYLTSSPVTGNATTVGAPQTQAFNAVANAVNATAATINWTNGSGHKRIVLMKANGPVDAIPVDGTAYTANTFFGSGTQLGSGNYTVFNSTGNNVTVTNLNLSNTYHIAVFEYNDFGGVAILYFTLNPARAIVTLSPPQQQATSIVANAVNLTTATISWTNGNGHKRIVLMKANTAVDANPVDNTSYTPDSVFASGTQLGSGNYTVFNGTGNSVTVTNLNLTTTYHVAVFEYNDFGGIIKRYLTINPARGIVSGLPQLQATNPVVNIVNSTTAIIGWTNGSGHKRIVLMKANAAVNANPVNNTVYNANASFGSGTQLGSGNYTVYNGTGNNVTVTNLVATNTYHIAVFEYNDFGGVNQLYLTVNPPRATVSFGALPVTFIDFTASEVNKKPVLQWSTAQEINSARFEVERSSDGSGYQKVGSVTAAGNSSVRRDYSFTDNTAFTSRYYYRLKQVDMDGRAVYSKVVSITIKDNSFFRLLGNPVKDQLRLAVNGSIRKPIVVSIIDMGGKLMHKQILQQQNILAIEIGRLSAGTYIVQLAIDNEIAQEKFIKIN